MFRYIHSTGVVVDDIDAALAFFVDTLGFEKRIDNVVDGGFRFVTVAPPGGQTETGFNPKSGDDDLKPPPIAFIVDDVDAVCNVLRAKQVEISYGPIDEAWGARGAVFQDPFGNEFYVTTARGRSRRQPSRDAQSSARSLSARTAVAQARTSAQ